MDLGIKGKVALVTGAGGGLGGAIAAGLAQEGVHVVVADIHTPSIERTVERIQATGGTATGLTLDLADTDGMSALIDSMQKKVGPVDILVNNSGGPPPTPVKGLDAESWKTYFDSMVLGLIHLTDMVLPGMQERGWGRIITSTSSGVIAPIPNLGISNTLRASLVAWSKTLAREVARSGVTCNVVVPGRIATERIKALDVAKAERDGVDVEQVRQASTGSIPMGRYGTPEEYAHAFAFLASEPAAYITGSVYRVDGGLLANI